MGTAQATPMIASPAIADGIHQAATADRKNGNTIASGQTIGESFQRPMSLATQLEQAAHSGTHSHQSETRRIESPPPGPRPC